MATESLIIFAKPPLAGRVKTRLIPGLGPEDAARLYACFLQDTAETALSLHGTRPHLSLVCEWGLERGESLNEFPLSNWLPGPFLHRAQTGESLGERMATALGRCLTNGSDTTGGQRRAVLIGTDFPDLPREVLGEAFENLKSAGDPAATLGPATDGGYYLIGMNRFLPGVFAQIPWSTKEVLALTLCRARTLGIVVTLLPEWRDTDDPEDLAVLKNRLLEAKDASDAPHTRNFLLS